ncbi:MAG: hypothetical protein IANPNBLG_04111 [Bryobacteraceae bacterium]|nr:hypothetical protein [Bryobacteraceae bacterium]
MELLLALAVIAAVIVFGALVSLGNERQRRAIDELREQVVLWALQDLRIKRERLARDVRVEDPIGWLNRVVAKVTNEDVNLQVVEMFEEPRALICASGSGTERVVFTPLSPNEIQRLKREKHSRLSRVDTQSPLFTLSHRSKTYEISILNGGIVFDRELPLAWKGLTGQTTDFMERVWMYWVR